MLEILQYAFMQKALVAGVFIAVLGGLASFFVVNKELGFIGTGIAHISFGGIALGIFIGFSPFLMGTAFAFLAALAIAYFSFKKKMNAGTYIGVFLAFSMAIGIIFIKLNKDYTENVFSYLFGSILGISYFDLIFLAVVTLIFGSFIYFYFKKLLLMIFDPVYAQVMKEPVQEIYTILVFMIAGLIMSMVKIVGIIMIEGLLVLPALSAYSVSKNYRSQLFLSLIFSFISVFGGLFVSALPASLPPGPSMVVLGFFIFLICVVLGKYTRLGRGR